VTGVRPIGGGWESALREISTASGPRALKVFAGSDRSEVARQEATVMARIRIPEVDAIVA
jgi:hypothetical protein